MRQGMNLGADDYIMKPFEVDELLEAIATRFKKQDIFEKHIQFLLEQLQQLPNTNEILEDSVTSNIEKLYADLAEVKQRLKNSPRRMQLTQLEKACLLEILSGNSPSSIAIQLNRELNGLSVDLSRGLYRYIEGLTGEKPKNWRDVPLLLSKKGYWLDKRIN
jgi:DNA-binding NarL/FixJ family response regulator